MRILSVGAAVNEEDHRHGRSCLEVRRPGQQSVDFDAFLVLCFNVLSGNEVQALRSAHRCAW